MAAANTYRRLPVPLPPTVLRAYTSTLPAPEDRSPFPAFQPAGTAACPFPTRTNCAPVCAPPK